MVWAENFRLPWAQIYLWVEPPSMCRLWLDLALSTCPPFVRGAGPTQSWSWGLKLIATVIHHKLDYNHPHQYHQRVNWWPWKRWPVNDEVLGEDDIDAKKAVDDLDDMYLDWSLMILITRRLLAESGEENLDGGLKLIAGDSCHGLNIYHKKSANRS